MANPMMNSKMIMLVSSQPEIFKLELKVHQRVHLHIYQPPDVFMCDLTTHTFLTASLLRLDQAQPSNYFARMSVVL